MKAAQIAEYGDASVIKINEINKPTAGNGQVLVEVHAASLNPFDTAIRSGSMKDVLSLHFPVTLGGDIAGEVVGIGEGVNDLSIGDKIYGQANVVAGNSGAFAEFAATATGQIAQAPKHLDFVQAASLPLVGVSAWQALTQHIHLRAGHKLFINGGAGGIGSVAIQIAKHLGGYVAVTATGADIEIVRQLGADEVVDYKALNITDVLSGYDAVFDTTTGMEANKLLTTLKSGGIAVSMIGSADPEYASELGVRVVSQSTHVTRQALDALRELIDGGVVSPRVGRIFPLDQVREAFEVRESGRVSGKVVLSMKL